MLYLHYVVTKTYLESQLNTERLANNDFILIISYGLQENKLLNQIIVNFIKINLTRINA